MRENNEISPNQGMCRRGSEMVTWFYAAL